MSQNVRVSRYIEFVGDANQEANIKGDLSTERMTDVDWFAHKAVDETNEYTSTVDGSSDAVAETGGGEIGITFTTGTADNDTSLFAATPLIFDVSNSPSIESRISITDVSGTAVFFGFSDAVTESGMGPTILAVDGTLAATATDAAGFVCDADKGTSSLYCASINNGGSIQSVDTGIDWTDGQSRNLRVSLDSSGNARFYANGVQVGYIASAVADVAGGFCAMYNYATRAADGANTVIARYLKKWCDCP